MWELLFGSAMVFLMQNKINIKLEKFLLGFASGVMIAASVWSLIIPAIEMAENAGQIAWLPATIGFLLGIFFLFFLNKFIPYMNFNCNKKNGMKLKKIVMMVLAITLHNIPEGIVQSRT